MGPTPESRYSPGPAAKGWRITGYYLERRVNDNDIEKLHTGIDFTNEYGTAVPAAADGVVIFSGNNNTSGYGNTVIIKHKGKDENYFYTLYAHLDWTWTPQVYTEVKKGETIGYIGISGQENKRYPVPHLHFETLRGEAHLPEGNIKGAIGIRGDPKYRMDPDKVTNWPESGVYNVGTPAYKRRDGGTGGDHGSKPHTPSDPANKPTADVQPNHGSPEPQANPVSEQIAALHPNLEGPGDSASLTPEPKAAALSSPEAAIHTDNMIGEPNPALSEQASYQAADPSNILNRLGLFPDSQGTLNNLFPKQRQAFLSPFEGNARAMKALWGNNPPWAPASGEVASENSSHVAAAGYPGPGAGSQLANEIRPRVGSRRIQYRIADLDLHLDTEHGRLATLKLRLGFDRGNNIIFCQNREEVPPSFDQVIAHITW